MVTACLRDHNRLDRASNFGVWKAKMQFLLDEHGLKEFVTTVIVVPIDHIHLHKYKKNMAKAKRMVLDGVRDHIILHIANKAIAKEVWMSL